MALAKDHRRLSIDLPEELYQWAKTTSIDDGVPMAARIRYLLELNRERPQLQATVVKRHRDWRRAKAME